jgi:hypothetical protein
MITFILISLALICLGSLAIATLGFTGRAGSLEELEAKLRTINLNAFRTLTDPAETRFLRMNLEPSQFRRVERRRIRAAMGYLHLISGNAKILIAIGTLARKTEDVHIEQAAQQLIDTALRTRLLVIMISARMLAAWLSPSTQDIGLDKVISGYEQLKDQLIYVISVKQPMLTSRADGLL